MKGAMLFLFLALSSVASAEEVRSNPLSKVFALLDELTAKIQKAGEDEDKAYVAYVEWCDDATKNSQNEIKTLTDKQAKLEASIAKLAADISDSNEKIESLVASVAKDS